MTKITTTAALNTLLQELGLWHELSMGRTCDRLDCEQPATYNDENDGDVVCKGHALKLLAGVLELDAWDEYGVR